MAKHENAKKSVKQTLGQSFTEDDYYWYKVDHIKRGGAPLSLYNVTSLNAAMALFDRLTKVFNCSRSIEDFDEFYQELQEELYYSCTSLNEDDHFVYVYVIRKEFDEEKRQLYVTNNPHVIAYRAIEKACDVFYLEDANKLMEVVSGVKNAGGRDSVLVVLIGVSATRERGFCAPSRWFILS